MMEPKIRFKGFEGEWRNLSITEIASLKAGKSFNKHDAIDKPTVGYYPCYGGNGQRGYLPYYNQEGKYNIIGRQGALCGCINVAEGKFYATEHAVIVTPINVSDFEFLHESLIRANINQYATGAAQPGISVTNVNSQLTLNYPIYEEQKALGKYFTSLDSQISASTSRLASLKQMKAASLQAMFPQEGETVPKIRFKGFEGEWKKVLFSETFEFLKNNSLSRAELSNEGDIVNVHYGDVLIKYGDLLNIQNEELTFIADNKIGNTLYNSCHLQNGDIIIADAAEDNTVGKCSEIVNICNKRVVSGLHTIPCRPLNRFALGYLGHYINSESYHNQLLPLIQGSKISSISKKTLSQTIVLVPSIEEQKCIGNYFTSLDRQISLQSQRLEKLKQIKSACLDKMFV